MSPNVVLKPAGKAAKFLLVTFGPDAVNWTKGKVFQSDKSPEEKATDARARVIKLRGQLAKARLDGRSEKTISDLERKLAKAEVDADTRDQLANLWRDL
jgi:hypothetical protein